MELSIDQVRERVHHAHDQQAHEPIHRIVAVLIMVVTLLAAVAAYLQTQAGTREAKANREAQEASVATMAAVVESERNLAQEHATSSRVSDLKWLSYYVGRDRGSPTRYAQALSDVYAAAAAQIEAPGHAAFGRRYLDSERRFAYDRFYEDQLKSENREVEVEKAASSERSGWASKRGRYVTVITIFAVALFLLGLSLTVPPRARPPFLWIGILVATAATGWGIAIFLSSVPKRPEKAIEAYVAGYAKRLTAEGVIGYGAPSYRPTLEDAASELTRAIRIDPHYTEAYVQRAYAHWDIDSRTRHGLERARADWERALRLDPTDYISWGGVGAADFWLNEYAAALEANERGLALAADDPILNRDEAVYLLALGRRAAYERQIARFRRVLAHIPAVSRNVTLEDSRTLVLAVEQTTVASRLKQFARDLDSIERQLSS